MSASNAGRQLEDMNPLGSVCRAERPQVPARTYAFSPRGFCVVADVLMVALGKARAVRWPLPKSPERNHAWLASHAAIRNAKNSRTTDSRVFGGRPLSATFKTSADLPVGSG